MSVDDSLKTASMERSDGNNMILLKFRISRDRIVHHDNKCFSILHVGLALRKVTIVVLNEQRVCALNHNSPWLLQTGCKLVLSAHSVHKTKCKSAQETDAAWKLLSHAEDLLIPCRP
jgi:hypothetical protein